MVVQIIRVGNSRGLRIPKDLLEQYQIEKEVDRQATKDGLLLKPLKSHARSGWGERSASMAKHGDDQMLLPESVDAADDDWEWSAPKISSGRNKRRRA
ncbi:MAG: AbrB/MazE/SpoVT family DNA-binding domain-containing protein [Turneriella sp.]